MKTGPWLQRLQSKQERVQHSDYERAGVVVAVSGRICGTVGQFRWKDVGDRRLRDVPCSAAELEMAADGHGRQKEDLPNLLWRVDGSIPLLADHVDVEEKVSGRQVDKNHFEQFCSIEECNRHGGSSQLCSCADRHVARYAWYCFCWEEGVSEKKERQIVGF